MAKTRGKKKYNKKMMCGGPNNMFMGVVKGLTYAYLITGVLFMLLAGILTVTNLLNNPMHQNIVIIIITVLAVVMGGRVVAKSCGKQGWMLGTLCGFIYYVIFFLIAYAFTRTFSFSGSILSMLVLCLGSGALGGFLGTGKSGA